MLGWRRRHRRQGGGDAWPGGSSRVGAAAGPRRRGQDDGPRSRAAIRRRLRGGHCHRGRPWPSGAGRRAGCTSSGREASGGRIDGNRPKTVREEIRPDRRSRVGSDRGSGCGRRGQPVQRRPRRWSRSERRRTGEREAARRDASCGSGGQAGCQARRRPEAAGRGDNAGRCGRRRSGTRCSGCSRAGDRGQSRRAVGLADDRFATVARLPAAWIAARPARAAGRDRGQRRGAAVSRVARGRGGGSLRHDREARRWRRSGDRTRAGRMAGRRPGRGGGRFCGVVCERARRARR